MDFSPKILYLVELTRTESELCFSSLFRLENYDAEGLYIDLVINNEVKPIITFFHEVEAYKWYSVFTFLPQNELIRHGILRIKYSSGLEIGSWKIYDGSISPTILHPPSSSTQPLIGITSISPSPSCTNCYTNETPLWRIDGKERYCNACYLYLKRNGTNRRFDENGGGLLRKKRRRKSRCCAACNTTTSPIWRNIDGMTYCNRDGLKEKKKKAKTFSSYL